MGEAIELGGPEGIRTPDLLHAMQTRSQLRHRPNLLTTDITSPSIVPHTPDGSKSGIGDFQRLDKAATADYNDPIMNTFNFQGFTTMIRIRQA